MANFVATKQYESSSESDNEVEIAQKDVQEKKVRRKFQWVKDKSFSDGVQGEMEIKQEKQWSRHYSNKGHDGIQVYYRCNQVKYRGKQCNAAIYLYYPNDSDKVKLYRSINEHDHTNSNRHKIFPEESRQNIEELFRLRVKPKKIYEVLQEKKFNITYNQLNNYLTQLRKKKFGPSTISLGQLESICVEKSAEPQCQDEPFIVSFDVHYEDDVDDDEDAFDDGNKFRFFCQPKDY